MKKLRTLSALALLTILTACGGSERAISNDTTANRGRANTEIVDKNPSSTNAPQIKKGSRTATTTISKSEMENVEIAYNAKLQKMYTDLNMSDVQIGTFQNEWKSSLATWNTNNRGKTMNSFERTEIQDRILKDLLNDAQFRKYQEWARDNAGTIKE